jgi:hypothetical protein
VEIVVRDREEFDQACVVFRDYGSEEAREADENRLAEEAIGKLLETELLPFCYHSIRSGQVSAGLVPARFLC